MFIVVNAVNMRLLEENDQTILCNAFALCASDCKFQQPNCSCRSMLVAKRYFSSIHKLHVFKMYASVFLTGFCIFYLDMSKKVKEKIAI